MKFINYPNGQWSEWDMKRMLAFNYRHGWCNIDENALGGVECIDLKDWHELYLVKHFCPLRVEKTARDVWISPDGLYYDGDAHEVMAEHILKLIYGEGEDDHIFCAGDKLEKKGWIRATVSMMWQVRFNEWTGKRITQEQYDALWDYCECHKLRFPDGIEVK
jgi:hypothetical protein